MQEIFYEESAEIINKTSGKVKYILCNIMSIISFILLAVWILFVVIGYEFSNVLIDIILLLIPTVLFIVFGIFMAKLKNKFYVDFDYTFVSGSVRFSKVIMNKDRESIVQFETTDIEKLGYYGSNLYSKYENSPSVIKEVLTLNTQPNYDKDFYYIVVNLEGQKYLYILECTKTFIVNILKYSSKTIMDEEFIKAITQARKNKGE